MYTRLILLLVFLATLLPGNASADENIAQRVGVVVIDAGHGGKFPGAHYGGISEKTLTLKVALKLGRMIEEQLPGVTVVYTRKTDKELGSTLADDLQARADIANKAGGDLFLSIHVNAASRATGVKGVETLIMGESSKEQRYNESALIENNREDLIDMSDERTAAIVRAYIQNLQFTYGEYSMAIARCIQDSYIKAGRSSRGVKAQLLRVLYATDMPGALTEIGFMTNAKELEFMKSERGQTEIARSLFLGVKNYFSYLQEMRVAEEGHASVASNRDSVKEPKPLELPKKTAATDSASADSASTPVAETAPVSTSAQPAKQTKPTAAKQEQPVRYTVQVIASTKVVPLGSAQFKSYRNRVKQYTCKGTFAYKYGVGEYADRAAAQQALRTVRRVFPDAFVARCRGGEIIK